MKGLRKTTACILAAILSFSSLAQPISTSAAANMAEDKTTVEKTEKEKAMVDPAVDPETKEISVTILEGKGTLTVSDQNSGTMEEVSEEERPYTVNLEFPVSSTLDLEIIPEQGYQVSLYKITMDSGAEEIIEDQELLNETDSYQAEVNAADISSVEVSFAEAENQEIIENTELEDSSQADQMDETKTAAEETKNSGEGGEADEEKEKTPDQDQPTADHTDNSIEANTAVTEETEEKTEDSGLLTEEERKALMDNFQVSREVSPISAMSNENVYLTTGARAYYEEYYTHWFDVDGRVAYCLEPTKTAPNSGYYTTTDMGTGLLRKAMYYMYGGPGYETYREWFGNIGATEYSEESEYAISHCMVSYIYTGSLDAFVGVSQETKDAILVQVDQLNQLPDPPEGFVAFYFNMGDSTYQTMGGTWDYVEQNGSIEIKKTSANTSITDGNSCYSLQGAKYEIYKSGTKDKVAEISTDSSGYGRVDNIPTGNYDIKEVTAPKGYALDPSTGHVTVPDGGTATYNCEDKPQSDPVSILLKKIDSDTDVGVENAEFTVKYYSGFYSSDPAGQGKKPERTWILKTDLDGYTKLSSAYKVSGDDFYYHSNGFATLPLGTITIQETKAPSGYIINPEVFVRQITEEGTGETVSTYNYPTVEEQSQKVVIRLTKVDAQTGGAPSATGTLQGAVYEIRNSSNQVVDTLTTNAQGKAESKKLSTGNYTVKEKTPSSGYVLDTKTYSVPASSGSGDIIYKDITSEETPQTGVIRLTKQDKESGGKPSGEGSLEGAEYEVYDASGKKVDTLTTDESGKAQSKKLPLGTYTVKEVEASVGFTKDTATHSVTLAGNTSNAATVYADITSQEPPQKGVIRLEKSDSETGSNTAQGGATLNGAIYEIKNSSNQVVATLTTDEQGKAESAKLPLGTYTVKEKTASAGYLVDGQTYTVKLTSENRTSTVFYKTVKSTEDVIRGGVAVEKWDSELDKRQPQGGASLEGAKIQIISQNTNTVLVGDKEYKKGDVITTLTTDENGRASTKADYLPYGDYQLKETVAPTGYTSGGTITRNFSIREDGKIVQMNTSSTAIKNEVIRGGVAVEKWDSEKDKREPQGEATLEGTKIQIISQNTNTVLVGDKEYKKGDVITTLTTDKDGKASTAADYLPYGTYQMKETVPPTGYTSGGTITRNFSIQEDGKIVQMNTAGTAIKNEVIRGGVAVEKWDSEKDKREPQGEATLEGTKIQIISQNTNTVLVGDKEYKKGDVITTLTTDKDGKASTAADYLPYGTYQLKETVPPTGYTSGGVITRNFQIRKDGELVQMNTSDTAIKNEVIRGGVAVEKWDSELDQRIPQGDGTLEGAKIQIISQNTHTVLVGEKEYKKGEVVATLTTDKDGKASTAADLLPYGNYQLKETVPPTGYTSGGTITRNFSIREDGKIVQMITSDTAIKNEVIRGGVTIAKWSLETNERKPQGGATLGGAKFTVTNRSAKAVLVDGQLFQPGEVIATVETDDTGLWTSAKDWLPYGTYEVVEIQEPDGYLPDGAEPKTFQIREDGKIVSLDNNDGAIKNQVKRGDLNFVKVGDGTLERLANVPFKITSVTTGESHTVVSDVNGQVDTSSEWNKHSQNTNRGETSEDGVWFSGTTEKEVPVNDEKGALPYDTYLIEEQRCESNEGYKLLSIKVTIYKDHYTVPLGTLTDDSDLVEITTTAIDSDTEDHYAAAAENTTIVDTVEYSNLTKGEEYLLKGTLMNKATGEPVKDQDGNPVTVEKTFTAKKVNGSVEMEFTFDASSLAGADVVVFEELYLNGNLIAEHADITDEDQTIHYPEIGTKAADQETGSNVIKADKEITIVDTVTYKNLKPGKKYKLTGTLMDKATGEPVKDAEGEEITAETSFKPETADGTAEVTFTFDGSNLAGKTIVVFESLERNDTLYAVHTDINDEAQTIYLPKIGTTAKDSSTKDHIANAGKVTLIDTVSYSNLTPGTEYTVKGVLMDKATGEPIMVEDQEVIAEATFKPESTSGTVEVKFEFDASSLAGHTLVVYEELYQAGLSIAEHTDINDEGQTIYIPEIGTTALDKENGTHNSNPDSKVTIVDTVEYKGLIPGKEYTVKGVLMDKETGKELQVDGKPVTAEKKFTAETPNGSVDLVYELDSTLLAGQTVVVFEDLYYDSIKVATHADINDEDQSIHFPTIGTTAIDSSTKDHIANAGKVTLIDTVSYSNLIPGQKYTVKGVLMDKATGKELLIGGKKVTAEIEFTPKETNGAVDLKYTFDASSLAGHQLVVFEELYAGGKLIGEHKDMEDEGQMVNIPEIHTNASDKDTGTHTGTVGEKVSVVDTVTYEGLIPGKEYTVKGTLMNKETGEPIQDQDGKGISAETKFTAETPNGSVDLVYELDSTLLAGQTVVVFEDLYYDSIKVATHADINDEDQSVHYPELGTKAENQATGTQEAAANKSVTILDTVSYQNLIPGQEYTVKGTLMDKTTGKELLIGDQTVTAEKTLTPEEPDGSVELAFTFDGSALTGKAVVVYERLYVGEKEVAAHADITDEGQTIEFPAPQIRTKAKDKDTGIQQGITKEKSTIVDTVSYTRLIPGQKYTMKGILMDKSTGKELQIDGKPVTAEKTFTPEKSAGNVEMTFTFDSSVLAGKTTVVFESLYVENTEVAAHADIDDKAQSVEYPKHEIGTKAKDKDTGTQQGIAKENSTIVDTISYAGLIPGQKYTIKGTLMEKSTGKELLENGKPIIAEKTFTAEKSAGNVEMTFTFDSSALSGETVVVFEYLYVEGTEVAAHADINDKAQSVEYPKHEIQTSARDKATGTQEAAAKAETVIVDTVTYKGLIPGQEYTMKGALMDKETRKELLVNAKPVTTEKKFTPEKSEGSIELEFAFDSTLLYGKEIVVFERLYAGKTEVAVHTDINDEAQTVKIQEKPVTPTTPEKPSKTQTAKTVKTGDDTPVAALSLAFLSASVLFLTIRRKRHAK